MAHAQLALAEDTIHVDTYSLREFNHDPLPFLRLLRTTHSHITLTLNDDPALVVLDPAEYQRLLDLASDADVLEGIRQGTEDIAAGRVAPADQVFAEIRARHGIPS
jgi:PHD/YefM family antitoxin component YafN of YafNO toxin-antitoxin module